MRRWPLGLASAVLLIAAPVAPALGGEAPVRSAQLKSAELDELTGLGGVSLVGFAWDGAARRFGEDFGARLAPQDGDRSFSVLGKGGAEVCGRLEELAANRTSLRKARLLFRTGEGAGATFKLEGLTVERTDCGVQPWTASLVAESVDRQASGDRGGQKKKKRADGDSRPARG